MQQYQNVFWVVRGSSLLLDEWCLSALAEETMMVYKENNKLIKVGLTCIL